jgi:hypothetical protein
VPCVLTGSGRTALRQEASPTQISAAVSCCEHCGRESNRCAAAWRRQFRNLNQAALEARSDLTKKRPCGRHHCQARQRAAQTAACLEAVQHTSPLRLRDHIGQPGNIPAPARMARPTRGGDASEKADRRHRSLSRTRRRRPCCCRSGNQIDEIAPAHCEPPALKASPTRLNQEIAASGINYQRA